MCDEIVSHMVDGFVSSKSEENRSHSFLDYRRFLNLSVLLRFSIVKSLT